MNSVKAVTISIARVPRHAHIFAPFVSISSHSNFVSRSQSTYSDVSVLPRKASGAHGSSQTSTKSGAAVDIPDLPPHSLMPTGMLLRAALVSTVSSKPFLLNTALKSLTYLTQTRISLFSVAKNPVLHSILKQTFYNHFCAGENGAEVRRTIDNLKDIGFKGVILTYAKEIVVDASLNEKGKGMLDAESGKTDSASLPHSPDIDSWKDGVLQTVELLGEDDFLALKLTGAGASVMSSLSTTQTVPQQMSEALEEICTRALARNVRMLVDAEQQSVQCGIDAVAIGLMRKYNKPGQAAIVYNTYQAYLKSCPDTLSKHMQTASKDGFSLGVKLVRGAYMASEPRHLINDTKADTDKAYDGIASNLLKQKTDHLSAAPASFPTVSLFLATHNQSSALQAHAAHASQLSSHSPTVRSLQYGQLLGMADQVSCSLLQLGQREKSAAEPSTSSSAKRADAVAVAATDDSAAAAAVPQVYKCLSWGPLEDCMSYLLRRARENKDAVARSKTEHAAVWAEIRRRVKAKFAFS